MKSLLLLYSPLFFIALSSALYATAWGAVVACRAVAGSRIGEVPGKRFFMCTLVWPPLFAVLLTVSATTFRHTHSTPALEHHSLTCMRMFSTLSSPGSMWGTGAARLLSLCAGVLAWCLLVFGLTSLLRLVVSTTRLLRLLDPFLQPPSTKLSAAMARTRIRLGDMPGDRFFECAIPAGCSSVIGLWRGRCVLSQNLVALAQEDELDAIVAHEACHLRGRDVRAMFAAAAAACFFFYLPPARRLARRWKEAAELACDRTAAFATQQPLAMARAILLVSGMSVVRESHGSESGAPAAAIAAEKLPALSLRFADGSACPVTERVERLIAQAEEPKRNSTPPRRPGMITGWVVTGAFCFGAYLLAGSLPSACFLHCSLEAISHLLP